jgi:signal transduction histidine kinase
MAILLAATGAFLYLRLSSELSNQITQSLRSRADDVAALVRTSDEGLSEGGRPQLTDAGESVAQVVDAGGRVLDATPSLEQQALLKADELRRARSGPVLVDRDSVPGIADDEPVRLLATPVAAQGQQLVVIVGASLDDRASALEGLRTQLLVGGPVALLLASIAGYFLAAAALRPVESMRRRAAAISATTAGQRLPLPPADDEIRRLGETLNELLARLEATLARERRFFADASHELRTPLALMKTELELALRRTRSPEELRAALESAAEETDRLSQLAEDLLVIARSDQGRLPLRTARLGAGGLLGGVADRYAQRARDSGR